MAGKRIVIPNYMPALDLTGGPVSGAKITFFENGTTDLKSIYTSAALSVAHPNPISASAAGVFASIFADEAEEFSVAITDADGSPISGLRNHDNVTPSLVYGTAQADSAAELVYTPAGTGATARTVQGRLRGISVSVEDFGAVPNDSAVDSTTAIHAAITYIKTLGGGEVVFEGGTYYANVVMTGNNVWLRWAGGRADYEANCLRPFSILSPPLTIGDDVTLTRNSGLINPNVSGVKIGGNAALVADNAPAAVHIKGNVAHLEIERPTFYNGVITLKMVPSATTPVTVVNIWGGGLRNDITDSATARTIYATYPSADGYFTDVKFWGTKINGPGIGYTTEYDGGALLQCAGTYFDMQASLAVSKGLYFTNGGVALFHGVTLDPLSTGQVIIETTDTTTNLNRVLQGDFRHGGQKWKNGSATVFDIPDEANAYLYKPSFQTPTFYGQWNFATSTNPYSTTANWTLRSDTGPWDLTGLDLSVRNTTEASDLDTAALQTEGGIACKKRLRVGTDAYFGGVINVGVGGTIQESGVGGGIRIDVSGTNQNLQLIPSGTGYVVFRGTGLIPQFGTEVIGIVGASIADVVATKYSDSAGLKLLGARKTGWSVATGTATRTTFDTTTVTLPQLAERVKAMIDDLHATAGHGVIGA